MAETGLVFEHIHIISEDPQSAAAWYADMLGGEIAEAYELRGAPQIAVVFEGITVLIRGRRPGENPEGTNSIQSFGDFASHNEWGMQITLPSVYMETSPNSVTVSRKRGLLSLSIPMIQSGALGEAASPILMLRTV